jgi:hypothetical protein
MVRSGKDELTSNYYLNLNVRYRDKKNNVVIFDFVF